MRPAAAPPASGLRRLPARSTRPPLTGLPRALARPVAATTLSLSVPSSPCARPARVLPRRPHARPAALGEHLKRTRCCSGSLARGSAGPVGPFFAFRELRPFTRERARGKPTAADGDEARALSLSLSHLALVPLSPSPPRNTGDGGSSGDVGSSPASEGLYPFDERDYHR